MNNTQIPIDELYDQLTLILQEEKYAKSTIQLYQEHVKRIKKFMLANTNITDYSSSVADQYYKKEVESRDYNYTTKRFFRTVIRRLNNICSCTGFVYSVPQKICLFQSNITLLRRIILNIVADRKSSNYSKD